MKRFRRRHAESYLCLKTCELCEGRAYVDGGDIGRFNSRTMEIEHDTERVPCPNAEIDEPDYDSMADMARELREEA